MIYRTRGYLPHLEVPGATYFLTLRLAGTLPQSVIDSIEFEIRSLSQISNRPMTKMEKIRLDHLKSTRIQEYLDNGYGECWLDQKDVAEVVQEAIRHHHGTRYVSHASCIMPNHLHWILTPKQARGFRKNDSMLIPVLQSFKSYTAHAANKILNRN
ncbi:MAG: hypothetical protein C5B54_01365 [Acidobacteria bacterium]|nr:MAG: hypothetical protein C5B54_01365 [Acidobacteriota bacterium]